MIKNKNITDEQIEVVYAGWDCDISPKDMAEETNLSEEVIKGLYAQFSDFVNLKE